MVIVDPRLDDAAIDQAVSRFTSAIEAKGELLNTDVWGRRKFAYEIDHLNEGYYVVAGFRASGELTEELDRLFGIGEEYLRAKVVRLPDGASTDGTPPSRSSTDDAAGTAAEGGSQDD